MPDALGVELEFMEHLCLEQHSAEAEGRDGDVERLQDLQVRMLVDHVSRWVPAYARDLQDATESRFYRQLSGLLADFVESDAEALNAS